MGPQFDIDFRYSQILNVIFISMMYSSGLPILYAAVLINFIILYWIDKLFSKNLFFIILDFNF